MTAPWIDDDSTLTALAVAGLCGAAFGVALERAGLGSARKLFGQFVLRGRGASRSDFTVMKVMFSAIVVAMLGAFWLAQAGALDLARVYVPETWIVPQLVGGLIFGAGMAMGGLCPGTSCVAAASGRGDGLAVIGGMFGGVLVTGLAFEPLRGLYDATPRGALTLPDWLGVSHGTIVLVIVALAFAGFVVAERVERVGGAA